MEIFVSMGNEASARDLLATMRANGVDRDIRSYMPLLRYYATQKTIAPLDKLLQELADDGVQLDMAALILALRGYYNSYNTPGVRRLILLFENLKLAPRSVYDYNLLLRGYGMISNIVGFDDLLMDMRRHHVEANEETYVSMAHAYSRSHYVTKIDNLLNVLRQKGPC